ncbi:hypothetical protein VPH35_034465 [Triticum aestivum]
MAMVPWHYSWPWSWPWHCLDCLGGDRLSALPDRALVRVLSHLPSVEAARTSALSRRWRGVFAGVPVVDLVDEKIKHRRGAYRLTCFDVKGIPIRAFRLLALDPPRILVDQWIVTVASLGVEEIDVTLRYSHIYRSKLCPFSGTKASADFDYYHMGSYTGTPSLLFHCRTLRRLRLTNWTLELPSGFGVGVGVFAACLQTLCLKRIMASNEVIVQLLYGCPLLADLMLEECPGATEITVPSDRLRSFAMVCCHNARRVVLYTPCLRSLRYKGGLPPDTSFLLLAGYEDVAAVTMDICEDLTSRSPTEVSPVMRLISWCRNQEPDVSPPRPAPVAYYCSEFMAVAGCLPELRHLVLKGFMASDHAVRSVAVLLVGAWNLEVLSLLPIGPEPSKKSTCYSYDSDSDDEPVNCIVDEEAVDDEWMTENLWRMYIPCMDYSLRRISIEKFSGNAFDRILAEFLLNKAAAEEIAMEFRSWLCNPYAVVTCT